MKRAHGTGSKTPLPDGRIWVRGPRQPDGTRPSLGYVSTQEEADALLLAGTHALRVAKREGAPLFTGWLATVLDQREEDGIRGIDQERRRATKHLVTAHFARRPIDSIKAADILQWIRALQRKEAQDKRAKRKISRSTVTRCLSLASVIFQAAVGIHIDVNPCTGLEVKKDTHVADDEEREEVWDWLRLDEQRAFATCEVIPEWARLLVMFAWGTGLRQGEQWNLKLSDLHVDVPKPYVFVRVGSKGRRPKSGKTRRVKLFGDALYAAKRWLEILPAYLGENENEHGLVFPTVTGKRRPSGAPEKSVRRDGKVQKIELLREWLRAAGIERDLRWHDMRHTFCSSLASGIWGAAWTLEEIKDAAGHSSVTVTEKYAHLCETAQERAIARMQIGGGLVAPGSTNGGGASSVAAISSDSEVFDLVGRAGHDPATYGLKGHGVLELLRALSAGIPADNPLATNLAAALASALEQTTKAGVS